ncbi:MAG: hypothetical protein HYY46_04815 [Deltaproteobacteria bacterium]|nr:hypothetical protein [Deltaproteobacteria bacterium]
MKDRGSPVSFLALITLMICLPAPNALSAPASSLPELLEAAKSEGQLNLVAQANVWGGVEGARM